MLAIQIFNALEAGFWFLLAGLAATLGHRTHGFTRPRQISLSVFLFAFGVSDAIEVFTGAWWKPPQLLILKAICLIGLVSTAALIYAARWQRNSSEHK